MYLNEFLKIETDTIVTGRGVHRRGEFAGSKLPLVSVLKKVKYTHYVQ